jgi:hypothetical protein
VLTASGKYTPIDNFDKDLRANVESLNYIYATVEAVKDRSYGKIVMKTDYAQNLGGSKKLKLNKKAPLTYLQKQ